MSYIWSDSNLIPALRLHFSLPTSDNQKMVNVADRNRNLMY